MAFNKYVLWVFAVALFFIFQSVAQATEANFSSLSGYVVDSASKETLIGASVYLEGTKIGAKTNKSGYFSISRIPNGKYTVIATYIGYAKFKESITFKNGESKKVNFKLSPSESSMEQVVVEGEREVERRQVKISQVNIPIQQIKQIRVGGESDVFRSLQFLPGILTSSQISSGLFVRGGSPDQNLVLLDGATVYNPSHLFGFISAFNSEAIKDVEMIKGGYPAEYGSRLSAVLNITQKDGNQSEYKGLASLGIISSRLSLEGPTPWQDGSFFIGGRRTYFDLIMKALPEDKNNPFPIFGFYDLNGKISQIVGKNDKIFVSGFYSKDHLDMNAAGVSFGMGISNVASAVRWTHVFGDNVFSTASLSYSRYNNEFSGKQSSFFFSAENVIQDYSFKSAVEWFANEDLTLKFGADVTRFQFDYRQNMSGKDTTVAVGTNTGGVTNLLIRDRTYSGYAQANYNFSNSISLQSGLRYEYWQMSKISVIDPRFALKYQLYGNVALKFAWGIYHQYLRLASQRDFSFFDTWLPNDSTVKASKAYHYIFSVETKPQSDLDLNFDFYYKKMDNLSEMNTFNTSASTVKEIFYNGNGESYGAELFLQKRAGNFTGWVGYALGYIRVKYPELNNGNSFRPKYDRRHDIKVVGMYKINERWEIGANFTFQSGQSYTGLTSRFEERYPGQTEGKGIGIQSELYGLRLPASHQLNINANYSFEMWGLASRLFIDIYNVYSRRDIWFRYYDTSKRIVEVTDVRLLPIIPTVSIEVKF